ncbi:MAG: energy-coupling factor transporter transmembrane component T [Eubacterium ventriosum]
MFISSLRRAIDLATAMEARCYHGGKQNENETVKIC